MKKTFITIIGIIAVLLAFTACQPKVQFIPGLTPGFPGGSGSDDVLSSSQQDLVGGALDKLFEEVNKATESKNNEAWSNSDYEGHYNLAIESDGSWELEAWGTKAANSSSGVLNGKSIPSGEWDITIVTSSEDLAASKPIQVSLEGTSYSVPVSEVVDNPSTDIPAAKTLNVSVRLAKHKKGWSEDHNNWKFVEAITVAEDGTVTIPVDTNGMVSFPSSNSEQGIAKWIPVLVSVEGIEDVTAITWNGGELTSNDANEVKDLVDVNGNPPENGEFVVWLKAEENTVRTIKIGDLSKTLTFTPTDYVASAVELEEEEFSDFQTTFTSYMTLLSGPAHLRTFHRLSDVKDASFAVNKTEVDTDTIAFDLTWNGYDISSATPVLVSGNLTMTFEGTTESNTLTATTWKVESDELTMVSGENTYILKNVSLSGKITKDTAFGSEEGQLKFSLSENGEYAGKILDIPENDATAGADDPCFKLNEFGESDTVTIDSIRRIVSGAQINAFITSASHNG